MGLGSIGGRLRGAVGRRPGRGGAAEEGGRTSGGERSQRTGVPSFITEAISDLREQGLLPVVAILIFAIPVAGIVFGATGGSYSPPASASGVSANDEDARSLMVVADRPGLREHDERLGGRVPRDPFEAIGGPGAFGFPDFGPAPDLGGAGPIEPGGGGGGGGGTAEFDRPGIGGANLGGSPPGFGTGSGGPEFGISHGSPPSGSAAPVAPEVRVETEYVHTHAQAALRFGRAGSGELREISNLPRLRGLPLRRPVAFYLGSSAKRDAALFSISPDIVSMSGTGNCLVRSSMRCYYLLLHPGDAVSMFDGVRMTAWRLALSRIDVIEREVDVVDEAIAATGREVPGPDGAARGSDRAVSDGAE